MRGSKCGMPHGPFFASGVKVGVDTPDRDGRQSVSEDVSRRTFLRGLVENRIHSRRWRRDAKRRKEIRASHCAVHGRSSHHVLKTAPRDAAAVPQVCRCLQKLSTCMYPRGWNALLHE